ncbi:MAG: DNA repair protein RecO [Planctomycetota bacterium]|nr:MAG: DNA repair protein RecO [Planctomycetota bacterium]
MALIKDTAIVLRRLDYSETSQVLVMFTRAHGQLRVIAKGVKRATRKKASTGIDLLEMGGIVFSQRPGSEGGLAIMTEWRQIENFPLLQRDLSRLYAAQYAAEVTAQLTEVNDPHVGLYDSLARLLSDLGTRSALAALVTYLWQMLREIGLVPELSRCMGCGSPIVRDSVVYFSSREGGAICRDCEPSTVEKRRIEIRVLTLLQGLRNLAADGAPPSEFADAPRDDRTSDREAALKKAFELLDYHLTETMGKQARLRGPLMVILNGGR